jgi:hypothetical protein
MRGYAQSNFPAFDRNAAWLRDNGWNIISPAEVDREIGFDETDETAVFTDADFDVAIRRDYVALTQADAIIFMPGWEQSTGAKLESDFANVLKLERYRVDADNDYLEKETVIGLTGYAQSGKNTIADQFVANAGFEQHGFADALKGILYELNPRIEMFNNDFIGYWHIQTLVDQKGWEEAKKEPEVRQLLQRLGTEGGRKYLGEDAWVRTLFAQPHGARIVISDVRFPNEAAAIRARGGVVIRVWRDGVGPINSHASDKIDFEPDFNVVNNGTPEQAYEDVIRGLVTCGIGL